MGHKKTNSTVEPTLVIIYISAELVKTVEKSPFRWFVNPDVITPSDHPQVRTREYAVGQNRLWTALVLRWLQTWIRIPWILGLESDTQMFIKTINWPGADIRKTNT